MNQPIRIGCTGLSEPPLYHCVQFEGVAVGHFRGYEVHSASVERIGPSCMIGDIDNTGNALNLIHDHDLNALL